LSQHHFRNKMWLSRSQRKHQFKTLPITQKDCFTKMTPIVTKITITMYCYKNNNHHALLQK